MAAGVYGKPVPPQKFQPRQYRSRIRIDELKVVGHAAGQRLRGNHVHGHDPLSVPFDGSLGR